MRQLPTLNGYTVDLRLREFRRVTWDQAHDPVMETLPFDSPKARKLAAELTVFAREVIHTLA